MNYRTMKTEELKKKLKSIAALKKWCEEDGAEETARHYALVMAEIEDILDCRAKETPKEQVSLFDIPAVMDEKLLPKARPLSTGQKLWRARRKARLTQEQLAERIGVTATTISRYETSERGMSMRTLEKLAKALGMETKELVGDV